MVTRAQVAAKAGTSTAVVSYVVNNGPRPVAPETRQRVLDAIANLNYRPNRLAQALRGKQSHVLGLIVPDISNPFYSELARTIENEADVAGYTLILGNSEQDAVREQKYVRAFLDRKVDGFFVIGGSGGDALADLEDEIRIPFVMLDRRFAYRRKAHFFGVDSIAGARMATEHLLSLGHRRIAAIAGPAELGIERLTGYREAMEHAGLEARLLHADKFERRASFEAARKMLDWRPQPTAVFATNDIAAISVMRAARDIGLHVPGDLAVVGFDDIQEGQYSTPRLTTVAQPTVQLGKLATARLIELVESRRPGGAGSKLHLIEPKLIIRESCGATLSASRN